MTRRVRSQRGMTLIEVIIGLFVLGTVAAAGATSFLFTVRQTAAVNTSAKQELAVTDFAEGLKEIPYLRAFRTGAGFGCVAGSTGVGNRGLTIQTNETIESAYQTRFRTWLTASAVSGSAPAGILNGTTPFPGLSASSFEVTEVEFWNAVTNDWDTTIRCHDSSLRPELADQGLQRLTLKVKYQGQTQTAQVVKRRGA